MAVGSVSAMSLEHCTGVHNTVSMVLRLARGAILSGELSFTVFGCGPKWAQKQTQLMTNMTAQGTWWSVSGLHRVACSTVSMLRLCYGVLQRM